MSEEFDNTPTAESTLATGKSMLGNDEIKLPWGRLYATLKTLQSIDLVEDNYAFGRALFNDVVLMKGGIPESKYGNISKVHFKIVREAGKPPVLMDYSKNGTFINQKLVGKGKKRILQSEDKISVGFVNLIVYVYRAMESGEDTFLSPSLREKYISSYVLGAGAFGEVRLVYEMDTCQRYAIKKVNKSASGSSKQDLSEANRIENEIKILKALSHDCVVQVIEIEETEDCVFIVLEYLEGGELTDRILSIEPLPESTVKFLFYQIVLAVQYLHSQGVTHRDLKPQNILLASQAPKTRAKVTDFGLSKLIVNDETCLRTKCGTPYYLAPEIWNINNTVYDKKVDVWSLGVLLYYMLARELPFRAKETNDLGKLILNGNYNFNGKVWGRVSNEVKDLITKMLTVDPEKRISIDEVLRHNWIEKDLVLQHDVAKLLNYIPEGTSGESFSSMEPPQKKLLLLAETRTDSGMHSWP